MPNSNAKGDRRERELVNRLDEAGFAVMRAPSSGSATERELPDVLAGNGGDFYAIEVKSSAGAPIYLSGEEVEALVWFARNFGAKPRVAARFDREDWYFFHPGDLHGTDGGNYRVKKETAVADGTDLAELTGRSQKVTLDEVTARNGGAADGHESGDGGGDGDGGDGGGDGPILDILGAVERGDLTAEEAAEML